MQSFGSLMSDNKGMTVLVGLLLAVAVVVLALLAYRGLFGRRLHMAGGRSRQPRLGVVDAFDLDRQRQLVLVRRDNVEHLIMIGGPNDLVIESAFVRAQPSVQVPGGRDKDVALPPVAPGNSTPANPAAMAVPGTAPAVAFTPAPATPVVAAPLPSPQAAPRRAESVEMPSLRGTADPLELSAPVSPGDLGVLTDLPAPGPVTQAKPVPAPAPTPMAGSSEPAETVAEPSAAPGPTRPVFPRPAAGKPATAAGALPPRPPLTTLRPTGVAAGTPAAPRPSGTRPPVTLGRGTSASSLRRDQAAVPEAGVPAPTETARDTAGAGEAPPPASPARPVSPNPGGDSPPRPDTPRPDTPLPITLDFIESLEEEMARLLGRTGADKK